MSISHLSSSQALETESTVWHGGTRGSNPDSLRKIKNIRCPSSSVFGRNVTIQKHCFTSDNSQLGSKRPVIFPQAFPSGCWLDLVQVSSSGCRRTILQLLEIQWTVNYTDGYCFTSMSNPGNQYPHLSTAGFLTSEKILSCSFPVSPQPPVTTNVHAFITSQQHREGQLRENFRAVKHASCPSGLVQSVPYEPRLHCCVNWWSS